MIMERDLAPLVNPDGRFAELSEVACAIRDGVYHAHLPQFRQWLELWKLNVPYRPRRLDRVRTRLNPPLPHQEHTKSRRTASWIIRNWR